MVVPGVVATPTDRVIQPKNTGADPAVDETETESEEQVKILEEQGSFDEVVVWGHEAVPAADDPFVKGVEEWVRLAEAVCMLALLLVLLTLLDEFDR